MGLHSPLIQASSTKKGTVKLAKGLGGTADLPYRRAYCAFAAYPDAITALGVATYTLITFGVKEFDEGNNFSTSTHLFTAPVNGIYWFASRIEFATAISQRAHIVLYVNGTAVRRGTDLDGTGQSPMINTMVQLTAGDTVGIYGHNDVGQDTTNAGSSNYNHFAGCLIGEI